MRRLLDVLVAVIAAAVCHSTWLLAVVLLGVALASGMQIGFGRVPAPYGVMANLLLLAQFPLLHSALLTRRGHRVLTALVPGARGRTLATTSFAWISSLQLLGTSLLWTPSQQIWWQLQGDAAVVGWTLFAASWAFLGRALWESGLGVQSGSVGWWALLTGRKPNFGGLPTRGLFRRCRQPIYLGFALVIWTAPAWSPDHLLLAAVWTPYCVLGPRLKEQRLARRHGAEFERYRASVPYLLPELGWRLSR